MRTLWSSMAMPSRAGALLAMLAAGKCRRNGHGGLQALRIPVVQISSSQILLELPYAYSIYY